MSKYTVTEINGVEIMPWAKLFDSCTEAKREAEQIYPEIQIKWDEFNPANDDRTGWVWGYSLSKVTFIVTKVI